ncbi:hypothetical protein BDP55DRAFT_630825 [Colletotrichum godetiae]|uniref:Uncharacterized protein n=1 Tax=Colletotrichum godetiae TaxID=1209918 RepID=A0AAJ0ETZ4_9PEZI|nr:uncharacterized protein BDP55DRAFT_630825 [Colletotrichum godetiae]KAK1676731.1 hypothetical protein BDP55DRAFT_630825 [Colletotrichum godetiae]
MSGLREREGGKHVSTTRSKAAHSVQDVQSKLSNSSGSPSPWNALQVPGTVRVSPATRRNMPMGAQASGSGFVVLSPCGLMSSNQVAAVITQYLLNASRSDRIPQDPSLETSRSKVVHSTSSSSWVSVVRTMYRVSISSNSTSIKPRRVPRSNETLEYRLPVPDTGQAFHRMLPVGEPTQRVIERPASTGTPY